MDKSWNKENVKKRHKKHKNDWLCEATLFVVVKQQRLVMERDSRILSVKCEGWTRACKGKVSKAANSKERTW